MTPFVDSQGTAWQIDLPIGTVNRIRSVSDGRFDLWDPAHQINGKPQSERLLNDLPTFWELLWMLVEPTAEERGVSAADFGLLMAADCLVAAQLAFFEEWADFFRKLQRPDQALALEKNRLYRQKAVELIQTRIAQEPSLQALDAKVAAKLEAELSSSLGKLQASLESILADSPGDNST